MFFPRRTPLPDLFHSSDTGAPFEHCLVCERPLLEADAEYVIEKAFRRYEAYEVEETIFEYALCLSCHDDVVAMFSDASKQASERYFDARVDVLDRGRRLLAAADPDPEADSEADSEASPDVDVAPWLRRCVAHDTPVGALREWQVLAHCVGGDLVLSHLPLVIGGEAVDELVQLLSNETIDELGGFRDEYFGLPPELQHTPSGTVLA